MCQPRSHVPMSYCAGIGALPLLRKSLLLLPARLQPALELGERGDRLFQNNGILFARCERLLVYRRHWANVSYWAIILWQGLLLMKDANPNVTVLCALAITTLIPRRADTVLRQRWGR